MNTKSMMLVLMSVLVATSVIPVAHAQANLADKATIPFDFYAGGHKMPAGNYTIGIDLEAKGIWLDNDSSNKMFLLGIPEGTGGDNSELVFKHSGNAYVLEEIKDDFTDLSFWTNEPALTLESRLESQHVEVALDR